MVEQYGIALFFNTRDAMKAEEKAKDAALQVRIIPTPGKIYAGCGFSLKYNLSEEAQLVTLLRQCGLSWEALYHARRDGLAAAYEQIRDARD